MIRKRLIAILLAAALASVVLGVTSFWRPFSGELSPGQRLWSQAVAIDGNARFIGAWDSRPASSATGNGIADAKLFWRRHLFVALPLKFQVYARQNPSDTRFGVRECRFDVSLFLLGGLLLGTAWLIGPGSRYLAHIPGVLREIRRPSDGEFLWPTSRLIRRTVVAIFGVIGLGSLALMIVAASKPLTWMTPMGSSVIEVSGAGMRVSMAGDPEASPDSGFSTRLPGFRLVTDRTFQLPAGPSGGPGLPPGVPPSAQPTVPVKIPPDILKQLQAQRAKIFGGGGGTSTHVLLVASWLPLVLALPYPIVALIRGPIRRHRYGLNRRCLCCGYNLTGLIEPRCPECGTAFDPALLVLDLAASTPATPLPERPDTEASPSDQVGVTRHAT